MALDDLVRIGKKAIAGEKARDSFDKNSKNNLALDLAKINFGDAGPNGQLAIDMVKNDSIRGPGYGPTKHGEAYNDFFSGKREGSYTQVQADIAGSFGGIGDDRVSTYLMGRAPVKYFDADQEILDAHANAYEAAKLKKDDAAKKKRAKEEMKGILADLKAKNSDPGMLKFVQSIAESTDYAEVTRLIDAGIEATIKAFGQIDPVKLRTYAQGRYEGITDEGARKAEAYEIAKAVAESN